jgi:AraC-like DNA-binding protein
MSRCADSPLIYRALHDSALVAVRDFECHAARGGPAREETSLANSITLLRRGAFCKHFGRRSETADANQAVFFAKGSTYRVSHPTDCGDRGTVFTVAPATLADMVRDHDPSIDDHPDAPFRFVTGPVDSAAHWRHRQLVRQYTDGAAADGTGVEPLAADVTALQLLGDVLAAAFARAGTRRRPQRRGTDSDHHERAEAAKSFLAGRLCERVALSDVAAAVHSSPFHLARVFQQRTGVPIHRYLVRLRLRASLERLGDGADDLTALALDLGFASHSHFSSAFRREFGVTPSFARAHRSRRTLGEMRKNLKA